MLNLFVLFSRPRLWVAASVGAALSLAVARAEQCPAFPVPDLEERTSSPVALASLAEQRVERSDQPGKRIDERHDTPTEHADTIVQRADTIASLPAALSSPLPLDTARLAGAPLPAARLEAERQVQRALKQSFIPSPQRALWLALVLPGAGQIYNRKYWKLPLVYGGFLGCTYAFLWNQQMYRDYSQAYLDIMDDDPLTNSFRQMFPPNYDIDSRIEQFKTVFKNRKDRFRRYRDMSAFCFIGVYLLSVVDAYVDAQLSVFDISPELSLQLSPATFSAGPAFPTRTTTGIGATLTF